MKWRDEEERTIALHSLMTLSVLFLAFIMGLIGLLPHLKFYDDKISFFLLTMPLCLLYLGFAAGAAYSFVRIALGQALFFKWRKQMAKSEELNIPPWYKKILFSPWWRKILFDKKGNLRKRWINICGGSIFLFWFFIMFGKLLT